MPRILKPQQFHELAEQYLRWMARKRPCHWLRTSLVQPALSAITMRCLRVSGLNTTFWTLFRHGNRARRARWIVSERC